MSKVPGITTRVRVTPDKIGSYQVVCTELCGLGHATMRQTVRVVEPTDFQAWAKGGGKTGSGAGAPAAGGQEGPQG